MKLVATKSDEGFACIVTENCGYDAAGLKDILTHLQHIHGLDDTLPYEGDIYDVSGYKVGVLRKAGAL